MYPHYNCLLTTLDSYSYSDTATGDTATKEEK